MKLGVKIGLDVQLEEASASFSFGHQLEADEDQDSVIQSADFFVSTSGVADGKLFVASLVIAVSSFLVSSYLVVSSVSISIS